MTFDGTKPDSAESPDQFPAQCQANWSRLETMISANHIFNNGADAATDGKHKFVVMPEQSAAPSTSPDEMALYTKETDSITELFLRREGDGTEIQMSAKDPTVAADGNTFLPGGLVINWGSKAVTSGATTSVSFSQAYENTAGVYSITTTINSASVNSQGNGNVTVTSGSAFTISNSSGANQTFFWMAIGKV